MKLKTTGKWRTVELDPHLQAKGFAEGLLGIEELPASHYNIIKKDKPKDQSTSEDCNKNASSNHSAGGKYVLKRPLTDDSNEVPTKKKKKTRQKRKPKNNPSREY